MEYKIKGNKMDIVKYEDYFHDGNVIDIRHKKREIELFISSAEIDQEDFEEIIPMDINDRITGILHLNGIKNIEINNKDFVEELRMVHPNGEIFDLSIKDNKIEIVIEWYNIKLNKNGLDYSKIRIEAEKIYWENKPELAKPLTDPNLENITHPDDATSGNYEFKDKRTGGELRFHKGDPTKSGHRAYDHFHRPNPNSNDHNKRFLDGDRNPVPDGSEVSHLYRPGEDWWNK